MMHEKDPRWLLARAANVTSTAGEDGIIAAALEVLPARDRWCVEFGAWDGKRDSNTWNLVTSQGYGAVLIEGRADRHRDLVRNFAGNDRVIALQRLVGFRPDDNLDAILQETAIPVDFDLLSIDIDGNDYHVWQASTRYRPKLVMIEFNPTVPPGVDFVQSCRPEVMQGSSLASLVKLASDKRYELVAATLVNALFVDAQYFPGFGIGDNSETALRADLSLVTHVFSGYDGRVFLRGFRRLPWHDVPMSERLVQQLPFFLRAWPEEYRSVRRALFDIHKRLRRERNWGAEVERLHRAALGLFGRLGRRAPPAA